MPKIPCMTIRGKEIDISGSVGKALGSHEVRGAVAIGFFVAYLATALVS